MVLFSGSVNTGCGPADTAVGPFYCPADHTGYFDTSFFDQVLVKQLNSSNGPLAQEYVVAHEVAHLVEMNHGPRFWAVVERLCPDHAAARAELRRHAAALPATFLPPA